MFVVDRVFYARLAAETEVTIWSAFKRRVLAFVVACECRHQFQEAQVVHDESHTRCAHRIHYEDPLLETTVPAYLFVNVLHKLV